MKHQALRSLGLYEAAVDAKHALQRYTYRGMRDKRLLKSLYACFIKPGDLVFDIGANVGEHTRLFLAMGARVVAVEPQRSCLKILKRRFGKDQRVQIVPCAVGDHEGQGTLHVSTARPLSSLSESWIHAVSQTRRFGAEQWVTSYAVDVLTLDKLIEQYGIPQFIKIDVEGYEREVISGLSRPVAACCFEYTPEHILPAMSCVVRLDQLGMHLFNYSVSVKPGLSSHWVSASDMTDILARTAKSSPSGDVYAMSHVY